VLKQGPIDNSLVNAHPVILSVSEKSLCYYEILRRKLLWMTGQVVTIIK